MSEATAAQRPPSSRRLGLFEGISQRFQRRRWTCAQWEVRQSHIFILPNRFGLYAGFLVLSSFAMGYKVQNNFILLAVIFLFLVFMLSLIASVRNLQGLRVSVHIEPYYFAGVPQHIRLNFNKAQPAFNLVLVSDTDQQVLDLAQGACSVRLPIGQFARGVYQVPPVKLMTTFPFGIATSWTWLRPPGQIVVCPQPHELAITQYVRGEAVHTEADDKERQQMDRADDLGDLRDYQPGDPPKRIDWKRFAATREAMVREHSDRAQGELVLTQPAGELEAALAYLAGGLQVAEKYGAPARMTLAGIEYRVYDRNAREQAYYAIAMAT